MPESKKRNSVLVSFLLIFFLLVVPVLWIMFNKTGQHYSRKLPILFERELDENGDTVYQTIAPFRMANQNGDSITLSSFDDHIMLVNFFFTRCETVCPAMNMFISQHIYREFIKDPEVRFVSFTVDPYVDSVQVLKKYEKRMNAEVPMWQFLTGNKAKIYSLAEHSFRVPGAESEHQGLFHSEQIVLVDKQKRVRGIFNTGGQTEKKEIIDAVRALKLEYRESESAKK